MSVSVWYVDSSSAAQYAAHVYAVLLSQSELFERHASPMGIFRDVDVRNMDVAVKQMVCIERLLFSEHLSFNLTRPEIVQKHPLNADGTLLQSSGEEHQHYCDDGDADHQRIGESCQEVADVEDERHGYHQSDEDGDNERQTIETAFRPEAFELLAMVLLHHDSPEERRNESHCHCSAASVRPPVG